MRFGNFCLEIPQGEEQNSGYIKVQHCIQYTVRLTNFGEQRSDAEVIIDGKLVGIWRIPAGKSIEIERPVHDTGKFTFYKFGTSEASKVGLLNNDNLGLVSVLFKPEKIPPYSNLCFQHKYRGGTGLSGKSEQNFIEVTELDYDERRFVRINIRLYCTDEDLRPLTPASTSVPPPVE